MFKVVKLKNIVKRLMPPPILLGIRKIRLWRRNIILKQRGLDSLIDLMNSLNTSENLVFIVFGTLLGLHREQKLIEHDLDIDIGCFFEDLPRVLERLDEINVSIHHKFYSKKNPDHCELTFNFRGIRFDIFVFHKANGQVYCTDYVSLDGVTFRQRFLHFSTFGLSNLEVENHFLCAPDDRRLWLETQYGKSFMTPVKDWDYSAPLPHISNSNEEVVFEIYRGNSGN